MNTILFKQLDEMFGEYRFKALREFPGHFGNGVYGSICRLGKKVGSFSDDGFGYGLDLHFINLDEQSAFFKHADRQTPDAVKKNQSSLLSNTIHYIAESFIYHLIEIAEALRLASLQAKDKHTLIALDISTITTSSYGHYNVDNFIFFPFKSRGDLVKAEELLKIKHSNLIFIHHELMHWLHGK